MTTSQTKRTIRTEHNESAQNLANKNSAPKASRRTEPITYELNFADIEHGKLKRASYQSTNSLKSHSSAGVRTTGRRSLTPGNKIWGRRKSAVQCTAFLERTEAFESAKTSRMNARIERMWEKQREICTFHPAINTSKLYRKTQKPVSERLYRIDKPRRLKNEAMKTRKDAKKAADEIMLCTFTPQICSRNARSRVMLKTKKSVPAVAYSTVSTSQSFCSSQKKRPAKKPDVSRESTRLSSKTQKEQPYPEAHRQKLMQDVREQKLRALAAQKTVAEYSYVESLRGQLKPATNNDAEKPRPISLIKLNRVDAESKKQRGSAAATTTSKRVVSHSFCKK